jgi:hypothetical protein
MKTKLLAAVAAVGLHVSELLGHRDYAAGTLRQGPSAVERCDYRRLRHSIGSWHLAFPAQSQWGWHERLMCCA